MRPLTLVLTVMSLAASWLAAGQDQVFRSRVDMVAVYPLASGPDGRLLTDLRRGDFTVLDNGRPVEIEVFSNDRQPITPALLLDMSESMADRWMRVRTAALQFVDVLGAADRVRIGSFGAEVALSPHLTSNKTLLSRILHEELWPGSSTPLWRAIGAGMQSLATESGRRTIAVVTDGVDTSSASRETVVERALRERFMIYAIGLEGKGLNPRLVELIGQTGGGHFNLKRQDDLGVTFLRVAEELRHQYLIGFTPAQLDGQAHSLEVRVNRPGAVVRAPNLFIAPVRK